MLIQKLSRPAQGLKLMQEIPDGALPAKLEGVRQKLIEQAQHMLEEGDSSCRMRCGKGEKRRTPSVGERCTHAERGYKEQRRWASSPRSRSAWRRRSFHALRGGARRRSPTRDFPSTAVGQGSHSSGLALECDRAIHHSHHHPARQHSRWVGREQSRSMIVKSAR